LGILRRGTATARATALRIISEAHSRTLFEQLPKIIEWYAQSPHQEDVPELLNALLDRLHKANDSLPDVDEDEEAWEDATVDTETVVGILNAVRSFVPMKFIASNAHIIEQMASVASEYYRKALIQNQLSPQFDQLLTTGLAFVAGLADYFDGGDAPMRSDAMEELMAMYPTNDLVHAMVAQAFEDGLAYDRRAGTLRERLPWLRWFFDQIPQEEFWRGVFASNPFPFAAGFQYLVWMGDASMENKTRAMWYSYLGDLARLGVRLEPDDVLHMSRSSELMGRLLCGQ